MSLYDWVQQFTKVKGGTMRINKTKKEVEEYIEQDIPIQSEGKAQAGGKRKRDNDEGQEIIEDYSEMFQEKHPQRQTHQPLLLSYEDYCNRVPNFIGGPLPRRDKGDAEAYAAAMLTLFKPWRNGMDLKSEMQNWSEVLDKYEFSNKFQNLMNNFNLRYECSDARDDFSAQRKLMANQGKSLRGLILTIQVLFGP